MTLEAEPKEATVSYQQDNGKRRFLDTFGATETR
jgi:hypothetical protein